VKESKMDRETHSYDYSDAWFLTTLIMANDWLSMEEIVSMGDALNHAIFTPGEIDGALKKLIPGEFVEKNADKYRATAAARELANCAAFKKAGLFTITDVILKRLNRSLAIGIEENTK
jgi:hypothetical protein